MAGSPWTNQVVSLIILTEATSGFSGFFGYSPTVGAGNLAESLAAAAGTDPESNTYPAGLQIGRASDGPQVALIPAAGGPGSPAELQFPVSSVALSNTPNVAVHVSSGTPGLINMDISGPALNTAGLKDWVQIVLRSNDTAGDGSHLDFINVDTNGNATLVATMTSSAWTFSTNVPVIIEGSLTVNVGASISDGASISGGLTVDTINGSDQTSTATGSPVTSGPNGGVFAGHTHDFAGHTHTI